LGLCLLAGACGRPGRAALVVLAGAGSMTLTLYCAHVLLVPPMLDALAPATVWGVQAVSALAVGLAVRAGGLRGPLEQVAAEAAAAARSTVAEGQAAR
jgi:Ca2+/H+ antiporter